MVCERLRSLWRVPDNQADAMVMLRGAAHTGRRRSGRVVIWWSGQGARPELTTR